MMTIAAEYLNRPGKEVLNWIYFLDDEAYLLSDNMQRMIQTQIESGANLTALFGVNKCGSEECWGICGGGCYFLNKETFLAIEDGRDRERFGSLREQTDFYDEKCLRAGDLTIARAIEFFHFIPVEPIPSSLPLIYHYPARAKFTQIHQWVEDFESYKLINYQWIEWVLYSR